MQWHEKNYDINGTSVTLEGTFEDSMIRIVAIVEIDNTDPTDGWSYNEMYSKPVNMWAHQEVLAEDILAKYMGMIRKCEKNLPMLVERVKLNKRI